MAHKLAEMACLRAETTEPYEAGTTTFAADKCEPFRNHNAKVYRTEPDCQGNCGMLMTIVVKCRGTFYAAAFEGQPVPGN